MRSDAKTNMLESVNSSEAMTYTTLFYSWIADHKEDGPATGTVWVRH